MKSVENKKHYNFSRSHKKEENTDRRDNHPLSILRDYMLTILRGVG